MTLDISAIRQRIENCLCKILCEGAQIPRVYCPDCAERKALCDEVERLAARWIPVEELLPEQEQWVMCLLEGDVVCPTFVGGLRWSKRVTHWMPLPPAPSVAGK